MKEAERHVVGSSGEACSGRSESKTCCSGRRLKATGTGMIASGGTSGIEGTALRQPKICGRTSNWKSRFRARLCIKFERREMTASKLQSTGRPKIVFAVTKGAPKGLTQGVQHRITAVKLPWAEESKSEGLLTAPPRSLIGSNGLALSSKEMNSVTRLVRLDLNQRWKRR